MLFFGGNSMGILDNRLLIAVYQQGKIFFTSTNIVITKNTVIT